MLTISHKNEHYNPKQAIYHVTMVIALSTILLTSMIAPEQANAALKDKLKEKSGKVKDKIDYGIQRLKIDEEAVAMAQVMTLVAVQMMAVK